MARPKSQSKVSSDFLPMSLKEAAQRGWKGLDVIIVTGDAYVDHPAFGAAIIGRVLEDAGFRVGIIAQPRWNSTEDFKKMGKPRLFFAVTAGNTDSMVGNFTPALKPRKKDVYSPDGKIGLRPNRAVVVYSNRIKESYRDVPIIIGGIEASLRRFANYDFWSNKVRQSILADTPADLLVYGMGELQIVEIAKRLDRDDEASNINDIDGTAWKMEVRKWREQKNDFWNYIEVPSYSEVAEDRMVYAKTFRMLYDEQDPVRGRGVVQKHPKTVVIQNKPMRALTQRELDHVYELPFTREAHPSYTEAIPALEIVKFSITTHRGCFGSCSFCAITMHQGRMITSRSIESVVLEAGRLTQMKDFKGVINGVGGPTANMYGMMCKKWDKSGACADRFCLYPEPCPALDTNHKKNIEMLRSLRRIPRISKVFVGYGVRYDLALLDDEYMKELCAHHISGQLRVAPEHCSKRVTDTMRKPRREVFEKFAEKFKDFNRKLDKEQYLVTYLISGHPGCTLEDMIELAEYIRDSGTYTKHVQDFTPTPMTAATCMFYTGIDPFTLEKVYVPRNKEEKRMQRALLQYREPQNYQLVYQALKKSDRMDLVGNAWKCLIGRRKHR
ncbi:MAG: YgiQ family radical SAM protein [Methanosarcinaceae archaeon]|nr:YgiQ family radical SAM protein [Methanosarcinaceae archaeon]